MLAGSLVQAQSPVLRVRVGFDDAYTGTSYTTPSDISGGGANVSLSMVNSNGVSTDYHGQAGSGVLGLTRALDFSSNPGQPASSTVGQGALAYATNQASLGFGTVTSFVATVWLKQSVAMTNTANIGGRVFLVGANSASDSGSANSLGLKFQTTNQLQFQVNGTVAAAVFPTTVVTNTWLFFAIAYNGGTDVAVYTGSETAAAAAPPTFTNNITASQVINFGTAGELLVGNRLDRNRRFAGWIDDFRFYTNGGDANFVEAIRWSALAPKGLAATPGDSQVRLNWTALNGAASYNVKRSTTSGSGYMTLATGLTGTTYTDSTALNGTPYYYVVTAVDPNGSGTESGNSNEASGTPTPPPSVPTIQSATAGNGTVTLMWTASTGAPTPISYNVKRATASGAEVTLTNVSTTSYTDAAVINGQTYYYEVSALNASLSESANSGEVSVTPVGPPPAPTGLKGAAVSDGQIALSWNASYLATSYTILRSTTSGAGYTTLATGVTGTTYMDGTAADGVKRYYYQVVAVNGNGTGPASTELGVLAALQLRFTFEDSGTTTTDLVSGASLNLLNGSGAASDYHGVAGSGMEGQGQALDFSSNPYDSPTTGPVALTTNNPALNFGAVTNFTLTFWMQPDSDLYAAASSATNNPRVFALAPGAANDYGANPGISLAVNNYGSSVQGNLLKMNLNGTETSPRFYATPHTWSFLALTYDGASLRLYAGSATSPVKLLATQANAGKTLNFASVGSLLLGNRAQRDKGLDAWLDDFRFYVVASDTNFLESVRQSAAFISLSNLYPNGSLLLQGTNTLSFNASSPNGINANGVQVVLNGADVSSQLTVGGSSASRTVAFSGLKSNQLYSGTIKITDATGAFAVAALNFDTFSPGSFTWEAEDFDYYYGQFMDNPAVDAYAGLSGGLEVDEHYTTATGNHNYRTSTDIGTDVSVDTGRLQYVTPQTTNDYYLGWWQNGSWVNYTRTYPAGRFNVYGRLSGGNGASVVTMSQVTSGQSTSIQTTTNLGTFSFSGNDWNGFKYVPLRDGYGNLAVVTLGGQTTLRCTADGNANANFYMLVPAQLNQPVIANVYPDGLKLLEPASNFTFTVTSPDTTINNSGIQLVLNGTDVSSQLVFTGTSTSKTVSFPGLTSNATYTAVITVSDANGTTASSTIKFDTFAPTLVWEAEDYDYNWGQYIDSPVPSSYSTTGSYFGLYGAADVDYHDTANGGPKNYRANDTMSTDVASDTTRQKYLDAMGSDPNVKDFMLGYFVSGEWANYTRTCPAGTYNVYARLAENQNTTATATLALVTNGVGTATQATSPLGTFSFRGTGWQSFNYVPLRDSFGNLASVTLGGVSTFRLASTTSGGVNVNFLMLVPARSDLPTIANIHPDGSMLFQTSNTLTFTANAPFGLNTTNIQLVLNGVDKSASLVCSGSPTSYNVSYAGLASNTLYTAVMSVTDNSSNFYTYSVTFDTFNPSYFTWEAEDFDFNGGQFIANPVLSSTPGANNYFEYGYYFGTPAIVGVDLTTPNGNTGEQFAYRPNESCGTAVAQDAGRAAYVAARQADSAVADYYVGWWSGGTWLNYTRVIPTNTYNLYARLAGGSGAFNVTASLVTSGVGTSNQVTQTLGTFGGTGSNWQGWQWLPLTNNSGQLATVSLGGTNTLRMTTAGGANANLYLLVPASAAPAAPVALVAAAHNGQVGLSWNGSAGASSYSIKRSVISGAGYVTIGSTASTNYTDSTVANGTVYYYVVTALNGATESAASNEANAAPQAPIAVQVTASRNGSGLGLSFPTQSGFTYQVWYKDDLNDVAWTLLDTVQGDGQTHVLNYSSTSTKRFYRILAQ